MANEIDVSKRKNINYIIKKMSNWDGLPEELKEKILETDSWWIDGSQSLLYYIENKVVIECGIFIDKDQIHISSAGCHDGYQWKD